MDTQRLSQNPVSLQQIARRNWLWLGLGLAAATLAVYQVGTALQTNAAPAGQPGAARIAESAAARPDPAAQSVSDYLRAHQDDLSILPPVLGVDPAAQSVDAYLQAHQDDLSILPPVLGVDPAVQSVNAYLRVHQNDVLPAPATDPAVQSVLDYLKAHGE